MRWAGHVARVVDRRGAYRVLVGRPEEKGPLERSKRGWEGHIKIDLLEAECRGIGWIDLAEDMI
jgi:hypothetical protein